MCVSSRLVVVLRHHRAASLLLQLNAEAVEKSLQTKTIEPFRPGDAVEVQVRSRYSRAQFASDSRLILLAACPVFSTS